MVSPPREPVSCDAETERHQSTLHSGASFDEKPVQGYGEPHEEVQEEAQTVVRAGYPLGRSIYQLSKPRVLEPVGSTVWVCCKCFDGVPSDCADAGDATLHALGVEDISEPRSIERLGLSEFQCPRGPCSCALGHPQGILRREHTTSGGKKPKIRCERARHRWNYAQHGQHEWTHACR